MQKKLLCGLATLGLMATSAFADKVIADFESGTSTAFTNYSYGYKGGSDVATTYTANTTTGYFSFSYTLPTSPGDNDQVVYQISIKKDSDNAENPEMKTSPDFPITDCTNGFSYRYKGAAHIFVTEIGAVTNSNHFKTTTKAVQSGWTTVTVTSANLTQEDWGENTQPKTWTLADINNLKWVVSGKVASFTTSGTLDIDDITCLTEGSGPVEPPPQGEEVAGYFIFEHKPDATENYATAYDYVAADKYLFGYSFDVKTNFANPTGADGVIWVDQGVGKIKGAVFGAAPSAGNSYKTEGAGLAIKNNPSGQTPNISDCVNGFSYHYRGAAHEFSLEFPGTVCGGSVDGDGSNKWGVANVPEAANWTKKTVAYSDITLYNTWDASACKTDNAGGTVDLSQVKQMAWVMGNKLSPNKTENLMITNVVCLNTSGTVNVVAPSASITINSGAMDPSPIIATHSMSGLTIAAHSRALHISSDRDAKVTLYGLNGKKTLSGMVNAGNSVFSLMGQKPGVYYAVVQTNSHTQTIKVVLK